jgi:DeoR/GlpR family transcriptional regulator of sugar metabolism
MLTSKRKKLLLDTLRRDGELLASALSVEYGVSEDTIRRDLRDLAQEGLLQRVHGGALPVSPALADLRVRRGIEHDAKNAIGRAAAMMVRPGQIVLIDGGTTAAAMVRALPRELKATVVTHSPSIAVELADHPALEVILLGGRLFKHSMVTVGAATLEALGMIRADTFFMGVTGVHASAGLSTGDIEEARIKRAMMRQAAECVVLASAEKLNAASAYKIDGVEAASTIIVEKSTPAAALRALVKKGLRIVKA